jgi:ribonuclease P protein component
MVRSIAEYADLYRGSDHGRCRKGSSTEKIARVSSSLKLAARDEKDLSAAQSTPRTHARIPRPDGDTGRPQHPEAPPGQGSRPPCGLNSAEAAWLNVSAHDFAFRATDRLHRRSEFLRAQRAGIRIQTTHFVIYAFNTSPEQAIRLGVTVARRIGGAVVRNRVKRRVRECFRLVLRSLLPPGTNLVVIARRGAGELPWIQLRDELAGAVLSVGRRLAAS